MWLPIWLYSSPNTSSVFLYNDSPFILTAIVQASDGSYLGQVTLQPGQQRNFTTNLNPTDWESPGTPDISLTPYSVAWQCASEGYYSIVSGVSPGAFVSASEGSGLHYCAPKPKSSEKPPASSLQKSKQVSK
ncbi:MAG: hypothetical protein HY069_01065 [Chlamydiia bacterium]|nr:hypothetical protein [Chlamydiia bacterium]